jgi:hypothetical protein
MQRIPIFLIVAILIVALYYYPPLRNRIFPEKASETSSLKSEPKEDKFDRLSIELYAAGIKVDNLRGKVALLKMAEKNRDWFKPEEYAQLPALIAKAEDELKQAEAEYEKVKIKYAQENVIKMIKEAMGKKDSESSPEAKGKNK